MKALLLAGGFGTRLRPLTLTRPKHLLPIANRPHIEHVFDLLLRHGIDEVVLTTSYLAQAFTATVAGADARGLRLRVTHEEVALGTAGAIKHAEHAIGDETFLVFNGDVLTDVDLGWFLSFHRERRAEASILLTPVDDPSAFGVVPTDEDGRVTGFIEKPPPGEAPTNLINAGVYALEPSVLDAIPAGQECSIERAVFPDLVAAARRVFAVETDAYWMDVGTPEKYLQANMDAIRGVFRPAEATAIASDASVHDAAAVSDACLGPRCEVEAGARIQRSVLLPGVKVGERAVIERSLIGEGAVIEPGAKVVDATIADGETVE